VSVIIDGLVRGFIADSAARPITVTYLRPGDALALARLAGRQYPTAFQAVVDSELLPAGNERFLELLQVHPQLGPVLHGLGRHLGPFE
jgi:CRP-like cAMP-binding protein